MLRTLALVSLLLPGLSAAQTQPELNPVYADAGQYTATLNRHSQQWQLNPFEGERELLAGDPLCPRTALPSPGLWLIGRDADGNAELIAPSATLLPDGHQGRVALRACNDPELRRAKVEAYGVPQQILERLIDTTGAILVND